MITIKDIDEAAQRLQPVVHNIPLSSSTTFSGMTGAEVFLKCENQQKTGSFKVRGAYNKIMKLYEAGGLKSVIASSRRQPRAGRCVCRKTDRHSGYHLHAAFHPDCQGIRDQGLRRERRAVRFVLR